MTKKNIIQNQVYFGNSQNLHYIEDIDMLTGKKIKTTYYRGDGIKIDEFSEYDRDNEKLIKTTFYQADGTTKINEYDPQTGALINK
ncbi:DUF2963 domain-containing protein [Candidatus Phytoplasma prunorum]|uniref:DUF2963 domain-containing protein n=1 Tax=Candidatus Phytoplasma prunorum TaxID=47565 RepID=UPI002FEFAD27